MAVAGTAMIPTLPAITRIRQNRRLLEKTCLAVSIFTSPSKNVSIALSDGRG